MYDTSLIKNFYFRIIVFKTFKIVYKLPKNFLVQNSIGASIYFKSVTSLDLFINSFLNNWFLHVLEVKRYVLLEIKFDRTSYIKQVKIF